MTCTNLGRKNLSDSVAIYGRGRELFRPPTYILMLCFDMVTKCLRTEYLTHEGISKSSWPESIKEYTGTFFISHFCSSLCSVSVFLPL